MQIRIAASRVLCSLCTASRAFSASARAADAAKAPFPSVPEAILRGHTRSIKFGRKPHAAGLATTQHPLGPLPGSLPVAAAPAPAHVGAPLASPTVSGRVTFYSSVSQLESRFTQRISDLEMAVIEMGGAYPDPPKPAKDAKGAKGKK